MRIYLVTLVIFAVSLAACSTRLDIPLEYPTPPPPAQATPVPPLTLIMDVELQRQFAAIASEVDGEVGAAAVVLETGEAAMLNANERFPMQSVYKLPIVMAVLEQVRRERLALDETIGVTREDMVRKGMRSPLRDNHPDGGEFTIRELIRLAMVESDGSASDVLLRVLGEAGETQAFLTRIGIFTMVVADSEKQIGTDWETQYRNFSTPLGAADLLQWLHIASSYVTENAVIERSPWHLLLNFMTDSKPGSARLKGLLPKDTAVAHKTGTSGTQNNVTAATNDIGIIKLPNGNHVAIAVFVSDSTASESIREKTIARIAKAAWDRWAE